MQTSQAIMGKMHQHSEQPNFLAGNTLQPSTFTTQLTQVHQQIQAINPNRYAKTRNFLNGEVTYLSPYISRGAVQLTEVAEAVLSKFKWYECEKLIQELAWREFFQRVWQSKGSQIENDLKQEQQQVQHYKMPEAISQAATQIDGLDAAITNLYQTGYMHNHARMYTAMLACNVAKAHWKMPAQWMYYHLLDGDLASNHLSWQWVAGSFSSKKYYANQENISKYTGSNQYKGYLAKSYEEIAEMPVPDVLQAKHIPALTTSLPTTPNPSFIEADVLVYNSYNVDAAWHSHENVNRVLLLEPSHFENYPVSPQVLDFIIQLGRDNIPQLQVFVGSFTELKKLYHQAVPQGSMIFKEHPLASHYQGKQESRTWLVPEVTGYFPSFFAFWKKCERYLK